MHIKEFIYTYTYMCVGGECLVHTRIFMHIYADYLYMCMYTCLYVYEYRHLHVDMHVCRNQISRKLLIFIRKRKS